MSNGSELKSAGAMALRAAGFKPCPRWWLTAEQMELVAYMAHQNEDIVNQIRAEAQRPGAKRDQHANQDSHAGESGSQLQHIGPAHSPGDDATRAVG